jgi:hypothetical protein
MYHCSLEERIVWEAYKLRCPLERIFAKGLTPKANLKA